MAPAAKQAAIDAVAVGNRYPDALRGQLIDAIASKHRVGTDSIVLGNGSTEILQIVTQAFAARQPTLVLAQPTFGILLRYQRPFNYKVEQVPLDRRFAHDLDQMKAKTQGGPSLVYLCNPNNPTGTLTPSKEIDRWIEESPEAVLFVVDEAYFDYVEDSSYWSASKLAIQRTNVVVTRTFSKVYGMAGMRLGYAIAHPKTANLLRSFSPSDNANGPALAAAIASIEDQGWINTSLESNSRAKKITRSCLQELDLEMLPSHTNFLMHRIEGQLDLYIKRMRNHGIRVGRPFPPMLSYNRLTLGLPEQMERFTEVLREFRSKGWI
jgi:histidinol-phosphate aminotransferase